MKRIFAFTLMLMLLGAMNIAPAPVRADESQAPAKPEAPAEAPKEASPKEAPSKDAKGEEGGGEKSKGPKDVSGGRFAGDPVYVHLEPMVMPVISNNGAEQIVTLQIDIEVKDFDVADTIHSNIPRIMDALMTSLYGGLGQGNLRNGKLVDIAKVKAKATTALESVVGTGGIKEVLIQGVSQRML